MRQLSRELLEKIESHLLPLAILLLLTIVAFRDLPSHAILINWDDPNYITKNVAIRGFSLHNLKLAFSGNYVGNYAPVQIISYMLDYTLWGLKPAGFFVANIFYHFTAGVLLYAILVRHGVGCLGALLGSALFLIHPVQVESVAWASQRKNLLAMIFYLAAFLAWLKYREADGSRGGVWYITSIIFFTIALLAKSVAVIFPVMLLLYDVLVSPSRRSLMAQRDKIPYFLAALVVGALAILTQQAEFGGGRVNYPDNLLLIPLTMLPVLASYLAKLFWPAPSNLCVMYFPPTRFTVDMPVLISSGVLCIIILLGIYLYRREKSLLFWYALFFLGLLPVSQIVPLVTIMNDRYLYFPMLGVAGVTACIGRIFMEKRLPAVVNQLAFGVVMAILVLLSFVAHERSKVWRDTITLFSDAVNKIPNQPEPLSRLAEGFIHAGEIATAKELFEKAVTLGALDDESKFNMGLLYLDLEKYDKVYEFITKQMKSDPNFKDTRLFLGEYYYRTGAFPAAEKELLAYLTRNPDAEHGLLVLGRVYFKMGNNLKAREYYYKAVNNGGSNPELFYSVAILESVAGDIEKSLFYLQKALSLGFSKRGVLEGDPSLDKVRRDPRFQQLFQAYFYR